MITQFPEALDQIRKFCVNQSRQQVFHVLLSDTVDISDLTVQNGHTIRDDIVSGNGGGIYNSGTLTLTRSTVNGNTISSAISFGGGLLGLG